jgi:hypothetical protein
MTRIGELVLPGRVWVQESTVEFVLGRVRRVVRIQGLADRFASRSESQSFVNQLAAEVERFDQGEASLSINPGREFRGRRRRFRLAADPDIGRVVFSLEVHARDRFEFNEETSQALIGITQVNGTIPLTSTGNHSTPANLLLTCWSEMVNPSFGDGSHILRVNTTFLPGETLEIRGEDQTILGNGDRNLLALSEGEFPDIGTGETALYWQSESVSKPTADLLITWRDCFI